MLEHGGKLRDAALRYNIPLEKWLDLSTGINPNGWLPENISTDAWNRLPEANDHLIEAAKKYYGCESLLAVAGSQAAIQALPSLFSPQRNVGILNPTYAEHAHAWGKNGHNITPLTPEDIEQKVDELDVLVIVNPNNPTGEIFSAQTLFSWHQKLVAKNGYLIVDEAFMDCTPEHSILQNIPLKNLIVLRSVGKFFGLAGIRVGFVAAQQNILNKLNETLGPWTISGPSRECAQQALNDKKWQTKNREYLNSASKRLASLLSENQLKPDGSTNLFSWVITPFANELHEQLARAGIFTRLFSAPSSLRFGLPADEKQWQQLTSALENVMVRATS
ncbi:MAG: threonine-phosphate decarboxylase CobD [Gammaproteobacteria bacterium]|nr:threonine-phosphate decarboxylase CobD [Gammaproteobacteria bacterium]